MLSHRALLPLRIGSKSSGPPLLVGTLARQGPLQRADAPHEAPPPGVPPRWAPPEPWGRGEPPRPWAWVRGGQFGVPEMRPPPAVGVNAAAAPGPSRAAGAARRGSVGPAWHRRRLGRARGSPGQPPPRGSPRSG